MTRSLGQCLPEALFNLLSGRNLAARMGQAILIVTTDSQGWPHPALLSYGEVVAVDLCRLRLAVYRTSRSSGNLRRNGRLTLCLIGPGMAHFIKTSARSQEDPMAGFAELARFEARVETVLADQTREDIEPGARITGGITFQLGSQPGEALLRWQSVVDSLRRGG